MRPKTAGALLGSKNTALWDLSYLLENRPVSSKRLGKSNATNDKTSKMKTLKLGKKKKKKANNTASKERLFALLEDSRSEEHVKQRLPRMTPEKCLEEKQETVDKLSREADKLEIRLIRQTDQLEKLRQAMIEEKRKRKALGGVKALKTLQNNINKQVRILENRLNAVNVRTCDLDARNSKTIEQINALRRDQITFERTYKRLQREFQAKQKEMAKVLEQSNQIYEERQEALRKLEELQDKTVQEEAAYAKEFSHLDSLVAEQNDISNYVKQTALKRREKDLMEQLATGNLGKEEEAHLKLKLSQLNQDLEKQEKTISRTEKNIQSYEEAFVRLYEHSGIQDMNEIVLEFVKNEDSNFALFNHIQHINKETEREEEQLRILQEEMDKYKKELGQNEGNRERIVSELQSRLQRIQFQQMEMGQRVKRNEDLLEGVAQATENLFFRIGCDRMHELEGFRQPEVLGLAVGEPNLLSNRQTPKHHGRTGKLVRASTQFNLAPAALQNSQGNAPQSLVLRLGNQVTEQNIMLYLGVVEQRTNEIIQLYKQYCAKNANLASFKGSEKLSSAGLPVPVVPKSNAKIKVHVPACNPNPRAAKRGAYRGLDEPDIDDEDGEDAERPMSSQQLREMTMRENQSVLTTQGSTSNFF